MSVRRQKRQKPLALVLTLGVTLLLLAAGVWLYRRGSEAYQNAAYPTAYRDLVEPYAAAYGLDPSLVMAVIRTESRFDPAARSAAGALGLMQMTESTFEWVQWREKVEDPLPFESLTDPETSIRYGCATLALLKEMFENEQTALAAYNAGMGNVRKWLADERYSDDGVTLKEIPFAETRQYVPKVIEAQKQYRALYNMA